MPKILFASNSISHFPGTSASNTDWTYDDNRVPYSIFTFPATVASSPKLQPSSGDETWFHFRHGSANFPNNDEPICVISDDEGFEIFKLSVEDSVNDGYKATLNTGAQAETKVKYIPMLDEQMRTIDIRLLYSPLVARSEVYINEVLLMVSEFTVSEKKVPAFLIIGGHAGSNNNIGARYSEIIVSEGDTRNSRLDLLRPVSAGVHGNWVGDLSSLADDDPTTGMTTTLDDQKQSTLLSEYTGATNISNVVQVTTTVRGENSPEGLKHLIRLSAVDYESPEFDIPFSKEFQVTDWTLNPATSQPWVKDDIAATEFGFHSIA